MHITFVAGHLDHNGAGSNISLDILANTLCQWGHEVDIITLNITDENNLVRQTRYNVIELSSNKTGLQRKLEHILKQLRKKENKTDLFHVFDPIFVPILGLYRKFGGTAPVVARLNSYTLFCTNHSMMDGECHKNCSIKNKIAHDTTSYKKQLVKLPLYITSNYPKRGILGGIDRYFAQSPSVKRTYTEAGFAEKKITTITNFYDPNFGDGTPPNPFADESKFNFLYVGRLNEIKGVDTLVRAVACTRSDVQLDIVGDGAEREALEALCYRNSSQEQISFHGWVDHDNLPGYYQSSNVFVHPGRWREPSGRALLEAMQCGCPSIVSDIGGPPWMVGDAGLTFKPDDVDELSTLLDRIATTESLYSGLQENCARRLEYFRPENIITDIEQEYESLVLK